MRRFSLNLLFQIRNVDKKAIQKNLLFQANSQRIRKPNSTRIFFRGLIRQHYKNLISHDIPPGKCQSLGTPWRWPRRATGTGAGSVTSRHVSLPVGYTACSQRPQVASEAGSPQGNHFQTSPPPRDIAVSTVQPRTQITILLVRTRGTISTYAKIIRK